MFLALCIHHLQKVKNKDSLPTMFLTLHTSPTESNEQKKKFIVLFNLPTMFLTLPTSPTESKE